MALETRGTFQFSIQLLEAKIAQNVPKVQS